MRPATNGAAKILWEYPPSEKLPTQDFINRLRPGMAELLTSLQCAESVRGDVWDFAVAISRLCKLGLADNELRWLAHMKYVDCAREVTKWQDDSRRFRKLRNLKFVETSCFVLTELGASFARSIQSNVGSNIVADGMQQHRPGGIVPTWDALRRELQLEGRVIKSFRWRAQNQEIVLASFEEVGWPRRIDDPIPPQPDHDQGQRLRDAIRSLNKHHKSKLIRFRGDGSGRGVVWEFVGSAFEP